MARYKQLTCPEEILQEKDDEEWSIQFRWLLAEEVEPPILIDCCFAWVFRPLAPGRVRGCHRCVSSWSNPGRMSRPLSVILAAPSSVEAIAMLWSLVPQTLSAPSLLVMLSFWRCLRRSLKKTEARKADENFAERVRLAIQQKLTGRRPTIEDIADALHISSRTMQRRLQDEGFSFQRVLEGARRQLARHYLNNSALELNEAAYLLGYEDGNSFVRAFRTWEGFRPPRGVDNSGRGQHHE